MSSERQRFEDFCDRHLDCTDETNRDVLFYFCQSWMAQTVPSFQSKIAVWLVDCFGKAIAEDRQERNFRFLEESLELVQAMGCTAEDAHTLVDYVFGRPVGEPSQEVGGVMVTLAALCAAAGMDMDLAANVEYQRIIHPAVMTKIRQKQLSKPHRSPLPGVAE